MKEVILSKSSIYHMNLSKLSLLDNDKLRSDCLVFDELSPPNYNYDKDVAIPMEQQVSWINDSFMHYFYKKEKRDIETIPGVQPRLIVNGKGESTLMRNHIEYSDLQASPDMIGLYFVHTDPNDSVIFHYEDHRKKDLKWIIPVKSKKFIAFHSGLTYYLPENTSNKKRIVLIFKYQFDK